MSLANGDLTTTQRVANWLSVPPNPTSPITAQLIGSMSNLIRNKLHRGRLNSQLHTRTFDGVGNMQLVLPDYPVTKIVGIMQSQRTIPLSAANVVGQGYGVRCVLWNGDLPGENAVLEFANGWFGMGAQNVNVIYQAGYLIEAEAATVPATGPYIVTVQQPLGICSKDNGITYADGAALTAVAANPAAGQYISPADDNLGVYTFSAADADAAVLISYSFVPADLEEACNQMVAERYSYRSRVGDISKSLGGQETMRYMRGGVMPWNRTSSLPPEVMDLIWPYVSVVPPVIGAPV